MTGTSGGPAYAPAGSRRPRRSPPALGAAAAVTADGRPRLRPIDPELLKGVSRNAPCPCGSGKKFKHCHGSF